MQATIEENTVLYRRSLGRMLQYSGRASVCEYRSFCICQVLIHATYYLLLIMVYATKNECFLNTMNLACTIYLIMGFIPWLSLSARRMHDLGKSAVFFLISFVLLSPVCIWVVAFILFWLAFVYGFCHGEYEVVLADMTLTEAYSYQIITICIATGIVCSLWGWNLWRKPGEGNNRFDP